MSFSPMLVFHICAALVTWPAGMTGLLSHKGSRLHRRAGNLFVVSMLSMSASGAYIAVAKSQMLNVVAGLLTFYLVATAWMTVRRKAKGVGAFEFGALLVSLAVGVGALTFGWQIAGGGGVPYFVFGGIALLGTALDLKTFTTGGVSGSQRMARHLWRMCIALLIDTMSIFVGKQDHFPEAIRKTHLLVVPMIFVAALTICWVIRVLFTSAYKRETASRKAKAYALST